MSDEEAEYRHKRADHWLDLRKKGNDEERWESIDAILSICVPTTSIPLFVDTLRHDTYWRARALAAHALYDLAWKAEFRSLLLPIIPNLIASLSDSSEHVRQNIVMTLELLGPAADEALPRLYEIVLDADNELAELARSAIVAIKS